MAISALSKVQQAIVLALVEARRLGQLPLLTSVAVKYAITYDAAHDIGEALLAAYGFRTANGPGQQ